MDDRPSKRVQRGFIRAGVVFGALPPLIGLGVWAGRSNGLEVTAQDFMVGATILCGMGIIIFAVFAAAGWILSGFFK